MERSAALQMLIANTATVVAEGVEPNLPRGVTRVKLWRGVRNRVNQPIQVLDWNITNAISNEVEW